MKLQRDQIDGACHEGTGELERIADLRLRGIVKTVEMNYRFMQGRGTVDGIFITRQIQEKMLEGNKKLYWAFIYREKAYDRITREAAYWCLSKDVPEKIVTTVT